MTRQPQEGLHLELTPAQRSQRDRETLAVLRAMGRAQAMVEPLHPLLTPQQAQRVRAALTRAMAPPGSLR